MMQAGRTQLNTSTHTYAYIHKSLYSIRYHPCLTIELMRIIMKQTILMYKCDDRCFGFYQNKTSKTRFIFLLEARLTGLGACLSLPFAFIATILYFQCSTHSYVIALLICHNCIGFGLFNSFVICFSELSSINPIYSFEILEFGIFKHLSIIALYTNKVIQFAIHYSDVSQWIFHEYANQLSFVRVDIIIIIIIIFICL